MLSAGYCYQKREAQTDHNNWLPLYLCDQKVLELSRESEGHLHCSQSPQLSLSRVG